MVELVQLVNVVSLAQLVQQDPLEGMARMVRFLILFCEIKYYFKFSIN